MCASLRPSSPSGPSSIHCAQRDAPCKHPRSLLDARQPPGLTWHGPDKAARGSLDSHCLCFSLTTHTTNRGCLSLLALRRSWTSPLLPKSTKRPDTLFSTSRRETQHLFPKRLILRPAYPVPFPSLTITTAIAHTVSHTLEARLCTHSLTWSSCFFTAALVPKHAPTLHP